MSAQELPEPDFQQLLAVLRGEVPQRPVLFEFYMHTDHYAKLTGHQGAWPSEPEEFYKLIANAFHRGGYDHCIALVGFEFNKPQRDHAQSVSQDAEGIITDWETFEKYQWPVVADGDYALFEKISPCLPQGMKFMQSCPGGVLENLIDLVGFSELCLLTYDEPELVQAIVDKIGSTLLEHVKRSCEHDSVGLIMSNDDWGFKSQTMLTPAQMCQYITPWHKKIVQAAHAAGRPAVLHSCGNLAMVYDDIINDIGYDGKHSYEDAIEPVEQAYEKLRGQIAVLGGIDIDFLARSEPAAITARAAKLVELGMAGGGYALGSGNSIPDWIPHENFLAMLKAARMYK